MVPARRGESSGFSAILRKIRIVAGDTIFPAGTVFVREFSVQAAAGPKSGPWIKQLVERRLHVVGAPRGYGASYRLDREGGGELIEDGEVANIGGGHRSRAGTGANVMANWWFPAIDDGIGAVVVNPSYRRVVSAAELEQISEEGGNKKTLLTLLKEQGWLETDTVSPAGVTARWIDPNAPPESRVRSYLHANCSVCHQPGGASRGNFDARLSTQLRQTGLIGGEPLAGDLGIEGARIVVPGAPEKSILYQRLKRTDFFRMPPVAYHDEPSPILPILETWIRSLRPE